ncbi:MAG: hypothetical protein EOP51_21415 [Sphingobacteriales bacterium]|nr:MAG: hypothetical protein EOP51_21415 [Sphingobacteriales bacterium]
MVNKWQQYRDIDYLRTIVLDLPEDYNQVKQFIIDSSLNELQEGKLPEEIDIENYRRIGSLRAESWLRKHVYFLVHDLLATQRDTYPEFDTLLLEIDSFLIGFCNPSYIDQYPGEPSNVNQRAHYVASYLWLTN